LLWLSSESEMVNFRSAIGGSLLLGVRSAARAPLELQPVDTSTRYKSVGEKTKATECLDAGVTSSSQLRAQMSVGALPQRTRVVCCGAALRKSTAPQAVGSRPVSVRV
jgi:hypothetical protein